MLNCLFFPCWLELSCMLGRILFMFQLIDMLGCLLFVFELVSYAWSCSCLNSFPMLDSVRV